MLETTSIITASASSFEPVIRVSSTNPEQEFSVFPIEIQSKKERNLAKLPPKSLSN